MKKENTILRERLSVYGEPFHAELRKERTANNDIIYHMYKVYDFEQPVFEEQIGCWSADNFDDAFDHFEKYCGLKYTEQYKDFMREYDKTREV